MYSSESSRGTIHCQQLIARATVLWFAQDIGAAKRMGGGRSFRSRSPWTPGQARSRSKKADLEPPLLLGLQLLWAAAAGLMSLPHIWLQMLCSVHANRGRGVYENSEA